MAKEKTVEELLKDYPTKTVKLPIDPMNPDVRVTTVSINGFSYGIQRGVSVEVPEPIYDILVETGKY